MSSCIVYRCPGEMRGQMISCPAHWSLLPEALRLEVVEAWDQLALERREGNPRRATRDRLRRLTSQAGSELVEVRRQLEERAGRSVGTDGRAWLRELRRLERPEPEGEPDEDLKEQLAQRLREGDVEGFTELARKEAADAAQA